MAAATNGAGIARMTQRAEMFEGDVRTVAQGNFLDELPGFVFALITLAYVITSLTALL